MKKISNKRGITLIALVVTIVVLLILAAVSISMLTGENGIIKNAQEVGEKTGRSNVIEQARADIMGVQSKNEGSISESELIEVLTSNKYNTKGILSDNGETTLFEKTLT